MLEMEINSFPSTDRQTDGENKSEAGTVLKNISIIDKVIGQND